MNGWGLAFRACGNQLMVGPVAFRALNGRYMEINAWKQGRSSRVDNVHFYSCFSFSHIKDNVHFKCGWEVYFLFNYGNLRNMV